MQIVKVTTPRSKGSYRCDLCGEMIEANTSYNYVTYRLNRSLKHLKCHADCYSTGAKLNLYTKDSISSFTFIRKCRDYIVDLHRRGNAKISKGIVESYPMGKIVFLIQRYFDILEAEQKESQRVSEECAKEEISLYITLFMMPMIFDDLIDDLETENRYTHKVKFTLKRVLKEFEDLSTEIWRLYLGVGTVNDDFSSSSMDVYDEIQSHIALKGVERSANIAMSLVSNIRGKFERISKERKADKYTKQLQSIEKRLTDVLEFEKYDFVGFIIEQKCSGKDINLIY